MLALYVRDACVAVAVKILQSLSTRSIIAVTDCEPVAPRVQDVSANPPPDVITDCEPSVPLSARNVTLTPSTPFPAASRTTTFGFVGSVEFPRAVWLLPATIAMV